MKIPKGYNALFVYGTLKNPNVEDDYSVKGQLFDVGNFPGIILNDANDIPGQIAIVSDKKLKSLDIYEGVPGLYTRNKAMAHPLSEDEEAIDVWVYQWARTTDGLVEINRW